MQAGNPDYTLLRRFPRVPVYCPAIRVTASGQEELAATNLNEGGLTLLKREAPPWGTSLQLIFELPVGKTISTEATTRSELPGLGFGLEFRPLDLEQKMWIRQTVQWAQKNPLMVPGRPPSLEEIVERLEMRATPRAPICFEVQLESATTIGRGLTCDVSLSGLGLYSRRPFTRGQQLHIIGPKHRFIAQIEIRNCRPAGNLWRVGARVLEVQGHWIVR